MRRPSSLSNSNRKDAALLNPSLRTSLVAFVAAAGAVAGWAADGEPLTLTAAVSVQLAMEHNETIGMARSDATAARAHVRETRADGLPDLAGSLDYTHNWLLSTIYFDNNPVKFGSDNELLGLLRLRQPLYTGGQVSGSMQSARSRVTAAHQVERQLRQTITAQVETLFYDYLLAAELARVRQLALQRARSNQRQVNALRRAGRANRFEWTRAGVQVSAAESDSIESANDLALAIIDLKDIIGLDLSRPVTMGTGFRDTSIRPAGQTVDELVQEALRRRPERLQLLALSKQYEGDERVARAGARPRLDLVAVGQVNLQDDAFSSVTDGDKWRRSWSTGLALSVPIFDGMRSRARVSQAQEARRRVQLQAEQLDRAIEREVRRAWMDVNETGQRLQARQGSVGQARLGLDDAEARYRAGAGTQLEVLDAQLSLLQAESEYARVRRDQSVALVDLERAVGVLGEDAGD